MNDNRNIVSSRKNVNYKYTGAISDNWLPIPRVDI